MTGAQIRSVISVMRVVMGGAVLQEALVEMKKKEVGMELGLCLGVDLGLCLCLGLGLCLSLWY